MQRLEIRLSLPAVSPLLQRLEPLAARLRDTLANPVVRAQDDEDFRELWAGELLEAQREDLAALAGLFDEEFHRSGRIVIDQRNADGVLRACSALRLHLRETELTFATDAQLESGEPDFEKMSDADKLAYSCYVVLATLQEIVIENLDLDEPYSEEDAEDVGDDEEFGDPDEADEDNA